MNNNNNNKTSRNKKAELKALAEKIKRCLESGHKNDFELGEYLEKAWGQFDGDDDRGKEYEKWVRKTMGHKSTKAGDARKLYRLMSGEFKDDLAKVSNEYKVKLKTSLLGYALSKRRANKMIAEGKWKKAPNNLVDIDFQPDAILLAFEGSDEVHDLLELTFARLRELTTPPPKDLKMVKKALVKKVERLQRELENAQNQLKKLKEDGGEDAGDDGDGRDSHVNDSGKEKPDATKTGRPKKRQRKSRMPDTPPAAA